jgi:uracil-DNA glycosylase
MSMGAIDGESGLETLAEAVRSCVACADLAACRHAAVPGHGPASARLMLVGTAPGRLGADRTGLPFMGDASGRRLTAALGSRRPDVYISNVVKCAPKRCDVKGRRGFREPQSEPPYDHGRCRLTDARCRAVNRDPSAEELARCRPFLERELKLVNPVGVVALGRLAEQVLQEILGLRPVPAPSGVPVGAAPFLAYLPHPAALGYHPDWAPAFLRHLDALMRAAGLAALLPLDAVAAESDA